MSYSSICRNRRLAAAAVRRLEGTESIWPNMILVKIRNPYVQPILRWDFVEQKRDHSLFRSSFSRFCKMKENVDVGIQRPPLLFKVLGAEQVRYVDSHPNYPEATTEMTRL